MIDFTAAIDSFINMITRIGILDVIDILAVAYIVYFILVFIKDTRAEQVAKGVVVLLVFTQLTELLRLYTIHWILVKILEVGFILPFIIFQPELRAALEHLGRTKFVLGKSTANTFEEHQRAVHEIIEALYYLSSKRIGALIVMERETRLNEIVSTGILIESDISKQLLINIFIPNTPLHDGALIIRDYRIKAASCFLPLTQSKDLSKELGTRHRAGIGVSEVSDCVTLIVSEETGGVSIAKDGKLYRDVPRERMESILDKNLESLYKDKRKFPLRNFFEGGLFR